MRGAPPIVQHRGGGPDLERAQAMSRKTMDPIVAVELLGGRLLRFETDTQGRRTDGIAFTAATLKKVPHKLGRKPVGWFVVRDFGANAHSLVETLASTDAQYLHLTSAATCKVYLWVF